MTKSLSIIVSHYDAYTPCFDIEDFIKRALAFIKITHGSFEFTLVNNDKILEINRTFLQHDYETDIITFNLGTTEDIVGDVYISVDEASKNATEYGQSLDDEIRLLIIHGILHLLGYDDGHDEDRFIMEAEQDRIIKELQK
jgi:probable rRNA maturation factor